MKHKIIVDSCCDLTPDMKDKYQITTVPLTMHLGSKDFTDDDSLDLTEFMNQMKGCKEKVGSASPAPYLYQEAFKGTDNAFVVTLSSQLSGSYNSAVTGKSSFEDENSSNIHIFDSKTASAGETLIALKLHRLLEEGKSVNHVLAIMRRFIDGMKTYFVLENYDNLQKNGRLGKVKGKLIQVLNIKLIMGADDNGDIALFEKARGIRSMLKSLLSLIDKSGRKTQGESLVISHCNNSELAEELSYEINKRFQFKEIFVIPTGGLSSLYTDDKGIVMAF